MKLKQWLREYHQMTYAEYKALDDIGRWSILGDFNRFNRNKQIHDNQNWRPMTEEEKKNSEEVVKMTGLIEEYAKEYAKEYAIEACIETMLECTKMSEKDIIERIIQKYNLTFDEAKSYYVTCKADVQDE